MVDQKVEGGPAWREGSRGTYLLRVSVCSPLCFLDVEGERLSSTSLFCDSSVPTQ